MRVRLAQPGLANELTAALRQAGCVAVQSGAGELVVTLPGARDAREETLELTFFVKAWHSRRSTAALELDI